MIRVVAGGPAREETSAHHRASRFTLERQSVSAEIYYAINPSAEGYGIHEKGHHWTNEAIFRVAQQRCDFLAEARRRKATHALMVDDDVLLPQHLLSRLLAIQANTQAAVVYGAYRTWSKTKQAYLWTAWQSDPAWEKLLGPDLLSLPLAEGKVVTAYGGGALTLFDLAQVADNAYQPIPRFPLQWGEDCHMNVRMNVLGLKQVAWFSGAHHAHFPEQRTPTELRRVLQLFGYNTDEIDFGDKEGT